MTVVAYKKINCITSNIVHLSFFLLYTIANKYLAVYMSHTHLAIFLKMNLIEKEILCQFRSFFPRSHPFLSS